MSDEFWSDHSVDPETITVGSIVEFNCPDPDCTYTMYRRWLPNGLPAFGTPKCRMHDAAREMVIVDVREPE